MKKVISTLVLSMALVFLCALIAFAAGSGSVHGDTITYSITDIPDNDPVSFSVYLLTGNAHIKCFGAASTKSPQAKNGTSVNKYNISPAINKGTCSSRSALKITAPNGTVLKVAERVSFSYTYVGGTFSATVSIENPASSLTGLAFVGKDGSCHYYPVGGGTIDISALVRQAARNAAGPGGSGSGSGSGAGSGGTGSGSGGGPGSGSGSGSGSGGSGSGSSGSGSGSGSGTGSGSGSSGSGGSYGPGGGSGNGSGSNSGSGSGNGGGSSAGSGNGNGGGSGSGSGSGNGGGSSSGSSNGAGGPSGNSGSGTGSGSGSGSVTGSGGGGIDDHAQDIIDIKDNISDITSPSTPTDHNNKGSGTDKPPCVLRRLWG